MKNAVFVFLFVIVLGGADSPVFGGDPSLELLVQFKESIMPESEGSLNSVTISPPELNTVFEANGVIYVRKVFQDKPEYRIVKGFTVKMPNFKHYYVLQVGSTTALEGLISALGSNVEVSGVEKNTMLVENFSCEVPDDTGSSADPVYQWYLVNDGSFAGHINIGPAWDMVCGISGADSPVIGLIDTGAQNIADELYVTNFGGIGNGHGTQVLGVISAIPDNDKGMSGVARNVSRNLSWHLTATEDFIGFVSDAIDSNVTLVSTSSALGYWKFSRIALKGVQELYLSGIPFVVASGQGGGGPGLPYPAGFGLETIGVSGTKKDGFWGTDAPLINLYQGFGQDICAPVDDVVIFDPAFNGTVIYQNGYTSFSQPLVAGTVALMKIVDGTLLAEDYEGVLASTAVNLGPSDGYDKRFGWGRLDAGRAVTNLAGTYELGHQYIEGYASVESTNIEGVYFSGFENWGIEEYGCYDAKQYKIRNSVTWSESYLDSVFCWGMHLGDNVNGLKEATLYHSDDGDTTVVANVKMSYSIYDSVDTSGAEFYTYAYRVYANGDTVDIGPTDFGACRMYVGVIGKMRDSAKVLLPNGGESFHTGYPVDVTWVTDDIIEMPGSNFNTVDIIFTPSGASEDTIMAGLDASLQSYNWTPTYEQFTSDGKIKVEYYNSATPEERDQDVSDGGFEIIQSLEPWVSSSAVYALDKDAIPYPTFAIEAVPTSSDTTIAAAFIDASVLGGALRIDLNDSGILGDVTENDGIWSAHVPGVTALGGAYDVPMVVRDHQWNAVSVNVNTVVVDGFAAKLFNVSTSVGDDLKDVGGAPYSAVTFNYNKTLSDETDWNHEDLIVAQLDAALAVFEDNNVSENLPQFERLLATDLFVEGDMPDIEGGARGIAVADFDNDGFEDFYVARNIDPYLYHWLPDSLGTGRFENVADSHIYLIGGDGSHYPANFGKAAAASWADYDQDGWVDLVVGRDTYNYPAPPADPDTLTMPTQGIGGEPIVRYHNENGDLVWDMNDPLYQESPNCFSVNWVDIDRNGTQDLFVSEWFSDRGPFVFFNGGFASGYSLTKEALGWFTDPPHAVVGAQFVDIDSDGYPDLVTASESAADNLSLYINDGSLYNPKLDLVAKVTSGMPEVGLPLNNLLTGDFDLNGFIDVMTLPGAYNRTPRLLFNGLSGVGGEFVRTQAFNSIQTGALYGGVANDWNGDGDIDLYLGRPKNPISGFSEDFFFQTATPDSIDAIPNVKFLKVRLVGNGVESNTAAIGARAEVWSQSQRIGPSQWVSGGDGRGGQRARTLVFGFPLSQQPSGDQVDVLVMWPDGYEEMFWGVTLNGTAPVKLEDTRIASIDLNSVIAYRNLNSSTGDLDWEFVFETNRQLTTPGVEFNSNPVGSGNTIDCFCGQTPGLFSLTNGAYGASVAEEQIGPWTWRYTVDWPGWCCDVSCDYEYRAFGMVDGSEISHAVIPTGPKTCLKKLPGM